MRILFVWMTCIALCGFITIGWYLSQSIVLTIAGGFLSDVSGEGLSLLTLIEFVNVWWGPIFDIIVLLWAVYSSQARDPTSEIYG